MKKKYAVFIDGDNIASDHLDVIMAEIAKDNDEILIKRIYGDWTQGNMNSWKEKISGFPIRVFQQFRNGPNATDNSIIMDAIELAIQNKDINAFCIVSGDADYYSLALRLRENGKYVLGIGKENSKIIWQNACNEFVKIENILKGKELLNEKSNDTEIIVKPKLEQKEKIVIHDKIELLKIFEYALLNSKKQDDGWINLGNFVSTIRSKYPSFDARTYGETKLLPLIKIFNNIIEIKSNKLFPPDYYLRKIEGKKQNKQQ